MNEPQRLDAVTPREYTQNGETKTTWTKIGTAFPSKDGVGYTIKLDALPLSGTIVLKAPKPRGDSGSPF